MHSHTEHGNEENELRARNVDYTKENNTLSSRNKKLYNDVQKWKKEDPNKFNTEIFDAEQEMDKNTRRMENNNFAIEANEGRIGALKNYQSKKLGQLPEMKSANAFTMLAVATDLYLSGHAGEALELLGDGLQDTFKKAMNGNFTGKNGAATNVPRSHRLDGNAYN